MNKATEIMKAALENGEQRSKELGIPGCSGETESAIGTVKVNIELVDHFVSLKQQSSRKTWELNGKRIAAAKLEKALNEAAH